MTVRDLARMTLIGAGGLLIAWLIATRTLPAYLATISPENAVRLRPTQPDALVRLAEQLLEPPLARQANDPPAGNAQAASPPLAPSDQPASAGNGPALDMAQRLLEQAVEADPLNARALRLLGDVAAKRGAGDVRTFALMKAASRRSLHESAALLWLLKSSLTAGNFNEAGYDTDALLRIRPQLLPYLVPALSVMAERPDANAVVMKLLRDNPPWRADFFELLPKSITNPSTPGKLLRALQDTPAPPLKPEIASYLSFLVEKRLYQEAYGAWLQFLPPGQLESIGLLYNGSFRLPLSGTPFDWQVRSGTGYTAEVSNGYLLSSAGGLNISFAGTRADFYPVSAMVVLAPGTYRVNGSWRGNLVGSRGLVWRLTCVGSEREAGSSKLFHATAQEWTAFQFDVTIPPSECPAQKLALTLDARSMSEKLVDGSIWFSNLAIHRQ